MPHDDPAAALIAAVRHRDEVALARLLTPQVHLVVDAGDATGVDVYGRAGVIPALMARLHPEPTTRLLRVHVNGAPGVAARRANGEIAAVLALGESSGEGRPVAQLWLTTAPRKLAAWNRRRPEPD
ncbi:hypothetical protein ABIQ69_13765 [Agromyces sp. G08B096]|uniref:Uncharacterized protein n=1 Tax=Agromyces sp. G08B096 TaxID=3156399 RepID=A0AAU7W699_9MICO